MLDLKLVFFPFPSTKYNYLLDALPLKTEGTQSLLCFWSKIDSAALYGSSVFNNIYFCLDPKQQAKYKILDATKKKKKVICSI